tara:strand:+ start:6535 stop:7509 length:975 start_codon:yes stop_codon:yes gene_type:complete
MSAIKIAQEKLESQGGGFQVATLIELLVEKYEGLPTVEEILNEPEVSALIKELSSKKPRKKKSSATIEERQGKVVAHLCGARIWKEKPRSGGLGYDNIQCSSKKVDGCNGLCKKHFKMQQANGLWTGLITEPRPENPVHPTAGPKMWCTDAEGNEVVKEKKKKSSEKKTVKKAKKSKKKKSPEDMDYEELEMYMQELKEKKKKEEAKKGEEKKEEEKKEEEDVKEVVKEVVKEEEEAKTPRLPEGTEHIPEEKKEEEDLEEDTSKEDSEAEEEEEEECHILKTIDGVEYQINKENKEVIRVDDFTPVGTWDNETETIEFEDEEE